MILVDFLCHYLLMISTRKVHFLVSFLLQQRGKKAKSRRKNCVTRQFSSSALSAIATACYFIASKHSFAISAICILINISSFIGNTIEQKYTQQSYQEKYVMHTNVNVDIPFQYCLRALFNSHFLIFEGLIIYDFLAIILVIYVPKFFACIRVNIDQKAT